MLKAAAEPRRWADKQEPLCRKKVVKEGTMFGYARKLACSFCGRKDADVAKLVAGPQVYLRRRVYICDACVAVASRIMADADDHGPRMHARQREWLERLLEQLLCDWKGPNSTSECGAQAK